MEEKKLIKAKYLAGDRPILLETSSFLHQCNNLTSFSPTAPTDFLPPFHTFCSQPAAEAARIRTKTGNHVSPPKMSLHLTQKLSRVVTWFDTRHQKVNRTFINLISNQSVYWATGRLLVLDSLRWCWNESVNHLNFKWANWLWTELIELMLLNYGFGRFDCISCNTEK